MSRCLGIGTIVITVLLTGIACGQEIVAHRGASADAPENTLAAFRLAWEQGADAIEGDFRLTADGHVVCLHDADTKRVTNDQVNWKVSQVTLEQLRTLDVGRWKGEAFAGERIPTLAEVLTIIPPGKKFFLEIKGGPELVEPIQRVLRSSGVDLKQVVIIAFDQDTVLEVRKRLPELKVFWLVSYKRDKATGRWSPTVDEVFQTLTRIKPYGLDTEGNPEVVNRAFVERLRRESYEFHVWTIDDPQLAKVFRDLGADSITTNRPGLIRKALQSDRGEKKP
ncbi:MAG: glycerophosphodiester phosphodiesterase [Thermogutta sp.]